MSSDRRKRINLDVYDNSPEELDELWWSDEWEELFDNYLDPEEDDDEWNVEGTDPADKEYDEEDRE